MNYTLAAKPHYPVLDGLRGVASLTVVIFHIFETYSTSHIDQIINHGYLAVDFFFLLSGFVIGYAYDDRWNTMTFAGFAKTRLIRLQPMVIMGTLLGAISFYYPSVTVWPLISSVPLWKMLLVMLVGFTMVPLPLSADIRGWNEMYPLNGPAWSLLYEYIVNIMYGVFIRKFSKLALSILVVLAAALLVHYAVTNGDVIGGWSPEPKQIHAGIARVMYPFFAGLLLFRSVKLIKVKSAFLWCSLLVLLVLTFPRIGGAEHLWQNGLYDALTIIFIFPLIVYLGAGAELKGKLENQLCKFLGDISFPIYITHYPIIYIYTTWVKDNNIPFEQGLLAGLLVFILAIAIAYACLKLYDEPVRAWLKKNFVTGNKR